MFIWFFYDLFIKIIYKKMMKIKDKDHCLEISIQEIYLAGMKPKEIDNLFKISKQPEYYWIHTPIEKKEKGE